ncbi:hypothetical protein [Streptomyces niveus]|uniref:hypothetical protein n=1 Tax=Streptomyces niveus TaxID=193462 RepID=UPI003653443D
MPRNDKYKQNVPYPILSDAPNIETAMQALVNTIVPLGVMRFSDANARAATFDSETPLVPGMVSYLIAEDRWDRLDGDLVWRPLTPGPWKPLTFASGYSAESGSPGYRIVNGEVQLRGVFRRSNGSDLITLNDQLFCTLPAEARPTASRLFVTAANFTTNGGVSRFTGRIGVLTNGQMMYLMPAGSTSDFLSLDGIRFSLT